MEIVRASKSAAVRLRVPVLHTDRPFADQGTAALQGIATAARLLDWARRQREDLVRV